MTCALRMASGLDLVRTEIRLIPANRAWLETLAEEECLSFNAKVNSLISSLRKAGARALDSILPRQKGGHLVPDELPVLPQGDVLHQPPSRLCLPPPGAQQEGDQRETDKVHDHAQPRSSSLHPRGSPGGGEENAAFEKVLAAARQRQSRLDDAERWGEEVADPIIESNLTNAEPDPDYPREPVSWEEADEQLRRAQAEQEDVSRRYAAAIHVGGLVKDVIPGAEYVPPPKPAKEEKPAADTRSCEEIIASMLAKSLEPESQAITQAIRKEAAERKAAENRAKAEREERRKNEEKRLVLRDPQQSWENRLVTLKQRLAVATLSWVVINEQSELFAQERRHILSEAQRGLIPGWDTKQKPAFWRGARASGRSGEG